MVPFGDAQDAAGVLLEVAVIGKEAATVAQAVSVQPFASDTVTQ